MVYEMVEVFDGTGFTIGYGIWHLVLGRDVLVICRFDGVYAMSFVWFMQ